MSSNLVVMDENEMHPNPLQVNATVAMRRRIREIAEREGISQAQVIRDILDAGIDARAKQSEAAPV